MASPRLAPILSDAVIDEALRRAERAACEPGDPRCHGFPFGVEDALRSMTPEGWCRIGCLAGCGGRGDFGVWCHGDTGQTRHARPADAG